MQGPRCGSGCEGEGSSGIYCGRASAPLVSPRCAPRRRRQQRDEPCQQELVTASRAAGGRLWAQRQPMGCAPHGSTGGRQCDLMPRAAVGANRALPLPGPKRKSHVAAHLDNCDCPGPQFPHVVRCDGGTRGSSADNHYLITIFGSCNAQRGPATPCGRRGPAGAGLLPSRAHALRLHRGMSYIMLVRIHCGVSAGSGAALRVVQEADQVGR
jgi:hypothetical protein